MTRDEFKTLLHYMQELWPRWTLTSAQAGSIWGKVEKYPLAKIRPLILSNFEDDTRPFRADPNLPSIYQRIHDDLWVEAQRLQREREFREQRAQLQREKKQSEGATQ